MLNYQRRIVRSITSPMRYPVDQQQLGAQPPKNPGRLRSSYAKLCWALGMATWFHRKNGWWKLLPHLFFGEDHLYIQYYTVISPSIFGGIYSIHFDGVAQNHCWTHKGWNPWPSVAPFHWWSQSLTGQHSTTMMAMMAMDFPITAFRETENLKNESIKGCIGYITEQFTEKCHVNAPILVQMAWRNPDALLVSILLATTLLCPLILMAVASGLWPLRNQP